MTQWSAFVGFTGVVLSGFLALARLSQRVVDDAEDRPGARADTVSPDRRAEIATSDGPSDTVTSDGRSRTAVPDGRTPRDRSPDEPSEAADAEVPPVPPEDSGVDARNSVAGTRDSVTDADDPATDRPLVTDPAAPEGPVAPVGEVDVPSGTADPTDPTRRVSPGALLANVALTQGLFGGLLAAAAWYFEVPGSALGLSGAAVEGPSALAVGVAFGVVLWIGNELATAFADEVGATYDEGLREMLAPDGAGGWALLLGATLPVIALVEEFLFRAAAIGATSAAFGGAWALAVVSSLAFALGHGAQGRVGIVVTGALGFALAAGFVLTGSFLVVVVAHYLVNALEFAVHEGIGLPDPVWS